MSNLPIFDVAGSALQAQSVRLSTIASNLANADSVAGSAEAAYKPIEPIFQTTRNAQDPALSGVTVKEIAQSQAEPLKRYEPGHPLADAQGSRPGHPDHGSLTLHRNPSMSAIASDVYSSLGLTASGKSAASTATADSGALQQADFLLLMTEQLKHQDPLKPMENAEFMGQLAQFSTVQGIQDLNTTVNGFSESMTSDQILRGASLVGHDVLVPSATLALDSQGGASGVVAAPSAGTVNFTITDANGLPVTTLSVPASDAGEVAFDWDGLDAAGNRVPAGQYSIAAQHIDAEGTASTLDTYVQGTVESVTVGAEGLYLNLPGLGTAPIEYVLRVS
jgi:flagellar basal-body rod modification protein FlgD